jgi:hypothetical protein
MEQIVHANERPKLENSWPKKFNELLSNCWHKDPLQRPSFEIIILELNELQELTSGSKNVKKIQIKELTEKNLKNHSSWF